MERIAEIGGRGIILEPTTELAIQTRNNLLPYAKSLGLKTIALVGAGNRKRQLERLKKEKPEIYKKYARTSSTRKFQIKAA